MTGWFVRNASEGNWLANPNFGKRVIFDTKHEQFPQLGVTIAVLEPGKPSGLYHAESQQEGFLVLEGECLLLVEGEERRLRQWDYFHCPPGTEHVLVGAEERCVVLMVGARVPGREVSYPRAEVAVRHGAAAAQETDSPHEAYAPFGHWEPTGAEPGLQ